MKLGLITMSLVMAGLFAHAQGEPAAPANTGSQMMEQKSETSTQVKKEKKHKKHSKKSAKAEKATESSAEGTKQ